MRTEDKFCLSVFLAFLFLFIGLTVFFKTRETKEVVTIDPGKKIVEVFGTQHDYHIITRPMTKDDVPACYGVNTIDFYGEPVSGGIGEICEIR